MKAQAIESYRRALSLATNESERRLLAERLRSTEAADAMVDTRL